MVSSQIQLITAVVAFVLMIVSAILSATSANVEVKRCTDGGCRWISTTNSDSRDRQRFSPGYDLNDRYANVGLDITYWPRLHRHLLNIAARYCIFVFELIYAALAAFLVVTRCIRSGQQSGIRFVEVVISGSAVLMCLVMWALEIWFATGAALLMYRTMTWAGAAVVLFVATIVWFADLWLCLSQRSY